MDTPKAPLQYIEKNFERFIRELCDYARIPSVSFPGYPAGPMTQSAQWTAERMGQAGLENVAILEIPGAHPYVYGDWLHAADAPTLLLYAHHDVQPPGREAKWISPPFEPTLREERLFGRGTADDKGGGMMHLAAIEAYLKTAGELPVNVRFLIEGEEETGSEHLFEFLQKYSARLQSDIMVLTDTANLEEGLPSLTYRLRGLVDAVVEVRTLDHPVHSGMWGGPGIDALSVLSRILSRLWTPEGRIAIPGVYDDISVPSDEERKKLQALPFEEKNFLKEMGAVANIKLAGEKEFSVYERLWCRPTISILGIDSPRVQETSNQLVESARAKVSMRIVAGMDPKKTLKQLCDFLAKDPPYGAEIRVTPGAAGNPWFTEPKGPAFAAAERALKKGFGRDPVYIGCGGSIPFVEPLTKHFGGIPALLMGIEDPRTNAHGENESLSLSDFKKGMAAAVHLYAECAAIKIRS
jgi:acetylornithine deacetylase/succinyl-diaminopimelate desuccinylase-like protein